jgi:hypothetical protein
MRQIVAELKECLATELIGRRTKEDDEDWSTYSIEIMT